ncbi:MAG: class I SAM-dependent methyltransferase [Cyclobacteriaceae bacterium]|nr:MAG: class I SAM-dependent methyltransferase [Cyclobacteriaceae bacterium]
MLFFILLAHCAHAQNPYTDVYKESAWVERDKWQKPQEIIRLMNIKVGSVVADVGCHEGYMTVKLANAVGRSGNVYAVDVEQHKLDRLKNHLEARRITNVSLIKGDYDNPKLPAGSLDAVIILDTYHEMDDHDAILQHIKASLKPGGRLVICEPIADERRNLSRAEQERKHELAIKFALEDLAKAGFQIVSKQENFVDRTAVKGDRMWIIVASR